MSYEAINFRQTFETTGSEQALVIDGVSIDGTTISVDYTVDADPFDFANININISGTDVTENFNQSSLPNVQSSVEFDIDWLEDGEEFLITANVTDPDELIQADQWTFEVSETDDGSGGSGGEVGDGDVTLQITSCGLNTDDEEGEFEIEYVDGGPLIAGIIVEAEVDGQYEGETSVAGQPIGPGETASGSISIDPPTEPGRYPVRVGIVTGSWDTF